jgi:prolyl 4-hydroxylase
MELKIGQTIDARICLREIQNLLTPSDCMDLLNLAETVGYNSSTVVTDRGPIIHPNRTSSSCSLNKGHTDLVKHIEELVMNVTGCTYDAIEPLQIVKYVDSQRYDPHFDYFDETIASEEIQQRGQRVTTILVYLLTPFSGGETNFPRLDIKVKPTLGNGVIWNNCTIDDSNQIVVNPLSEHGGMPVIEGSKVALNIWVRSKPKL